MIEIHYGNSYSKIKGLQPQHEKKLRKLLSYSPNAKTAYFSGGFPRRISLLTKKNEFPTGLLHRVEEFLKIHRLTPHYVALFVKKPVPAPTCSVFRGPTPYHDQLSAVRQAMDVSRGTISMPTGTGKSLAIALLHARLNVKTLIVVPSLEIKRQLIENLKQTLSSTSLIRVENIDSPTLKSLTDFDCLIIDEAHHVAAKTYQKLNKTVWKGIYYRYFFTATPFRNNTEENLLFEAIAGEVIYKLSYKEAIKKGYIVPIEAYYVELPKKKTHAYTWAEVYSELIVNNEERNSVISDLLKSLNEAGKSALCLVKEVKHGNTISESTGFPFVCGIDADSRQHIQTFNEGNTKILIGTTGVLGEGVDTKPCEYVLITGLGKAKSQFMQQVGRAVRKYPGKESAKVILFQDKSHRFCSRHFKEQCDILKTEYGITPIKLEDV